MGKKSNVLNTLPQPDISRALFFKILTTLSVATFPNIYLGLVLVPFQKYYLLRPMKILSGKMVSLLLPNMSESNRGVLANMVLSKCSMALKLRSSDLREYRVFHSALIYFRLLPCQEMLTFKLWCLRVRQFERKL